MITDPERSDREMPRIVVFDGICNLCNGAVNFIIARDTQCRFLFASRQGDIGRKILTDLGIDADDPETFVLVKQGRHFVKSDAALEIARDLNGAWRALRILAVIPRPLRDSFYDWLARNRYRLFGRRESCLLPTAELRNRFL